MTYSLDETGSSRFILNGVVHCQTIRPHVAGLDIFTIIIVIIISTVSGCRLPDLDDPLWRSWPYPYQQLILSALRATMPSILLVIQSERSVKLNDHSSVVLTSRINGFILILYYLHLGPPLWSSGQSFWLQIQRPRVRFPALPDFLSSSGSGTGSTQPREVS